MSLLKIFSLIDSFLSFKSNLFFLKDNLKIELSLFSFVSVILIVSVLLFPFVIKVLFFSSVKFTLFI